MVGAGDDDSSAGCGIVAAIERSSRKDPGEDGRQDDCRKQQDEGMRQARWCDAHPELVEG
jgi:hypothetical protein